MRIEGAVKFESMASAGEKIWVNTIWKKKKKTYL